MSLDDQSSHFESINNSYDLRHNNAIASDYHDVNSYYEIKR